MSNPGPDDVNQLNDPAFQDWLKQLAQPIDRKAKIRPLRPSAHGAQPKGPVPAALDRKLLRLYQQ